MTDQSAALGRPWWERTNQTPTSVPIRKRLPAASMGSFNRFRRTKLAVVQKGDEANRGRAQAFPEAEGSRHHEVSKSGRPNERQTQLHIHKEHLHFTSSNSRGIQPSLVLYSPLGRRRRCKKASLMPSDNKHGPAIAPEFPPYFTGSVH